MLIYQYGYGAEIFKIFKERLSTREFSLLRGSSSSFRNVYRIVTKSPYEFFYRTSRITAKVAYSIDRVDQDRYD